jgi:uncharacterized protein YdaU (DUF1376 family)
MNTQEPSEPPKPAPIRSTDGLSIVKKTINELEIDAAEYCMMRKRLTAEKAALQSQLAEIKAACTTRLPQQKYHSLQKQRAQLVRQLMEKEQEIATLNETRVELNAVTQVRKRQAGMFSVGETRELVEIRDKWHGFSMDAANHQKAREVAWKISQELREVLKRHFDASADA